MPSQKILVADDSLTIQKVIRLALGGGGSGENSYQIQTVSDGNEAIQQISIFKPDIVIIDVALPIKSAFEIKQFVDQNPESKNPRFILMSSAFEKVDEPLVAKLGFSGRLTKPFDPAHLRQVIQEALSLSSTPSSSRSSNTEIHLDLPQDLGIQKELLTPPPLPPMDLPPLDLDSSFAPPPPPATPKPSPPMPFEESHEIKKLTESTFQMSEGSSDFNWSVSEPSLKPFANLEDTGGSNFPIHASLNIKDTPTLELELPTDRRQPSAMQGSFQSPSTPPPTPTSHSASHVGGTTLPINTSEMEALMKEEIKKQLKSMLPNLAEKLIREEIHKLLVEKD